MATRRLIQVLPLVPEAMTLADVLEVNPSFSIAVGQDEEGEYLVVRLKQGGEIRWLCAPASRAAINCVRSGRSGARSVLRHSSTGTVQVYTGSECGGLEQSVVLCSALRLQCLDGGGLSSPQW